MFIVHFIFCIHLVIITTMEPHF